MQFKTMLVAGVGLCGVLLASPAFANFCGGFDKNGCSVSPVTYKGCLKDTIGDYKDLKCDIIAFIFGRGDFDDIRDDLAELKMDLATLHTLRRRYSGNDGYGHSWFGRFGFFTHRYW